MVAITFIAFAIAAVAIFIFIYFNRHLQDRREAKREEILERKQEFLQQLLEMKKKHNKDEDDEVSDTTKAE